MPGFLRNTCISPARESIVRFVGEIALKAVADTVLELDVSRENTEQAIQAALTKASPEVLLKLKQAENDFKLVMQGASAQSLQRLARPRSREASRMPLSVAAPTQEDKTARNLAYAYTLGYFALLRIILFRGVDKDAQTLINTLVGVLTASQVGIMAYYFG